MPVLIALEAGDDVALAKRAYALHLALHTKHAELVHTRFIEGARTTLHYLRQLSVSSTPSGYRGTDPPVSALASWYGLLRDKRKHKLDFVKALARAFAVDPALAVTQDDVDLARFVADVLATLDYKTQEECFVLVAELDRALGAVGMQTSHLLRERLGDDADDDGPPSSPSQRVIPSSSSVSLASLARCSVVLSLAIILRDHLKVLYKLTDACVWRACDVADHAANSPSTRPARRPPSATRRPSSKNKPRGSSTTRGRRRARRRAWRRARPTSSRPAAGTSCSSRIPSSPPAVA